MQYAYILSLIDADLERLRMARQLLIASQTLVQNAAAERVRPSTRVPGHRKDLIPPLSPDFRKQRPAKHHQDKAEGSAPIAESAAVIAPYIAPPVEPLSPIAAGSSSDLAETLSQLEVRERTSSEVEQIRESERRSKPRPQESLTTRRLTPQRPVAVPRTALNSPAPGQPVFIPAEQIRQEQQRRQDEMQRSGVDSSANVPLTAELLAQRWIASSAD